MKKILIQIDSDKFASVFDAITAYDAGADRVIQYGGVTPNDVRNLVYGAIFTRGGDTLKNSSVFIGGSEVSVGEEIKEAAVTSFFGPLRVSVMMDSNGCNTTAAAAVRKIASSGDLKGKKVTILGGTGPVGMRAAGMLAAEGAEVSLTSRSQEKAERACTLVKSHFGAEVRPVRVGSAEKVDSVLDGVFAILCAGAAGITLLPESVWKKHGDLRILADVNAVPPLGVENTKPHWDGKEVDGKIIFGALGIGGLKMKIHRNCVSRLFTRNDLVLDAEEIYDIAQTIEQK